MEFVDRKYELSRIKKGDQLRYFYLKYYLLEKKNRKVTSSIMNGLIHHVLTSQIITALFLKTKQNLSLKHIFTPQNIIDALEL